MPFQRTVSKSSAGFPILRRTSLALWLLLESIGAPVLSQPSPMPSFRVPPGFNVFLFAGEDLAPSPQAVAVDANGNVVVTGPGYLRTLLDEDSDGVADQYVTYASPVAGGTALALDGSELLLAGSGGLNSYFDDDFDGVAESGPNRLLDVPPGEMGIHGLRRGPDGAWYLMGGMTSGFGTATLPGGLPTLREPQAGVQLRWSPGLPSPRIIAHGFRNPRDLEFNNLGDLFTADTGSDADFYLPSHAPSRFFHIAYGAHHGWRTSDLDRGWVTPDYFLHGVRPIFDFDYGLPTALAAYRHYQFPAYYQGGLFVADWRRGRVYFVALTPSGATYRADWEVFMEAFAGPLFAPSDLAVMPDGSLLVAAGGRRLPGGLYRVEYLADPASAFVATNWVQWTGTELQSVLQAPQPLTAWSRAYWAELAGSLGPGPFAQTVLDETAPVEQRIRAIDILTEIHGGLGAGLAESAARSDVAEIRGRVAWSLNRSPCPGCLPILSAGARDAVPYVRVQALDTLLDHASELDMTTMQRAIGINLTHPEPRVRDAAIRLAARLTDPAWNALWALLKKSTAAARLSGVAIALSRPNAPPVHEAAVEEALAVLDATRDVTQQLEAVQLIQAGLAFGSPPHPPESSEILAAYRPSVSLEDFRGITRRVEEKVGALFPARAEALTRECARLLGMLPSEDPALPGRLLERIQPRSAPASDMHYLAVLSRLPASVLTNVTTRLAKAFLATAAKLPAGVSRDHLHWGDWQAAILQSWLSKVPQLTQAFLRQPDLAEPGNERWVPLLDSDFHEAVARRFLEKIRAAAGSPWSPRLVEILSVLPREEVVPLFRRQWDRPELRDALLPVLAKEPSAADRDKYLWALESEDPEVAGASLTALMQLPLDPREDTVVGALRLLRRLVRFPEQRLFRTQVMELLRREPGFPFDAIAERGTGASFLEKSYAPVFDWFARTKPRLYARLDEPDGENPVVWESRFAAMQLKTGDVSRGAWIYRDRGCQGCHTGTSHLGPDLGGIGLRLARQAVFEAVVFPNRHIAPGYRAAVVEMNDRTSHTGAVALEMFDLLYLQPDSRTALRLSQADIRAQYVSHRSYMPAGLLKGLDPQGLADLFAFLGTLPLPTP